MAGPKAGEDKPRDLQQKSEFARREEQILKFWNDKQIFEKSLQKPAPKGEYIFYDGPPFANGLPHYGHILAGTIKDAIPRYKTMRGYRVPRRWGWDCHGLPVENLVEKELGLRTKRDIEAFGIARFNEAARTSIMRDVSEWKWMVPRLGRWVDMEHDFKTMDTSYTESVWWAFKQLHEKGLLYEGFKAMHYCPRCGTTLANFEVAQGYKDIEDYAVTVRLPLVDKPETSLLIWTTTPWTLPGNAAAAVNPDALYVKVKIGNEFIIAAKGRAPEGKIVEEFLGEKLVGKKYKPPFDYYRGTLGKQEANAWKVYAASFVSLEEGTGIVHIAPAYGTDDLALAQKENVPLFRHVNEEGKFTDTVKNFTGLSVKPKGNPTETDEKIIAWLKAHSLLFAEDLVTHSYPHCWRCDTPLLNWVANSWFIKVSALKKKLLAQNRRIRWVPLHVGRGRFAHNIETAPDWAISRSRFWGAPIPAWRCTECARIKIIGSIAELVKHARQILSDPIDLHRPSIDVITVRCPCGGSMSRDKEVFDCWFESGAMPFASHHYPFEKGVFNPRRLLGFFPKGYPADFIAEGLDQTRGWFYSLLVLSTALFGASPYRSVIVNGLVLAEDGQKMSKRLKNYPDPMEIVSRFGADALRYYLLSSPVTRGENLNFSLRGVEDIAKRFFTRLDNVRAFYELYAPAGFQGDALESLGVKASPLDRWILARLSQCVEEVTKGFEAYELDAAVEPLAGFVDDLSTWWLRRSRDRIKQVSTRSGEEGLATMRHTLCTLAKLMAPIAPFFAEFLFLRVREESDPESVHLAEWPPAYLIDHVLIADMRAVRVIASRTLKVREEAGIKIRQPLGLLEIKTTLSEELLDILKAEVNVKEVRVNPKLEEELSADTTITEALREEGVVRDLIRRVQEWRKQKKLAVSDRPDCELEVSAEEERIILKHRLAIIAATGLKSLTLTTRIHA